MLNFLKRTTAFVLFAAMMLGVLGGIASLTTSAAKLDVEGNEIVNLLDGKNPSFEDLTIPNWTFSKGVSQSNEHVFGNGGWSLKIFDASTKESFWALNDKIDIQAGGEYTLSVQVLGAVGELTAMFYDANGAELTNEKITVSTTAASDSWQLLETKFVAPANAAKIAVKVASSVEGNRPVFFDALSLSAKAKPPVESVLVNGNFDAEWTGSIAPGWRNSGSTKTTFERVPNGDGYAMALTKASGSGYTFISERFDVEPGYYYTASIDIKLKTATACGIYLRMVDANGAQILNKVFNAVGDFTSDWKTIAINEKAPANAVQGYLLITDPKYNEGVSYFDNAQIRRESGVVNGSFESGAHTSEMGPAGWISSGAGLTLNTDTDYVRTGCQSFGIVKSKQPRSLMINVKAGEEYEASIYVKRQAGQTDTALAQLYLRFYDEAGNRRSVKDGALSYKEVTPVDNEWVKLSLKSIALDGEVYADFLFTAQGTGIFYFDDAEFKQLTNNNIAKNLLKNGGFDSRTVANNTPLSQWHASSSPNADSLAVEYAGAERGYVGRFFNTEYMVIWTKPIPVTTGEQYSLTLDVKGSGRAQGYIYYYANEDDARGDYLLGGDGKAISKFTTSANLSKDSWTQVAVAKSEAPEGAKYARIWVCALKDTLTGKLDFQVDDVCFFKGIPQLQIPGEVDVLRNPGFEELDENGNPKHWGTFGQKVFSVIDAAKDPENVYDGRYALMLNVPEEMDGTHGVSSGSFPIQPGMTYRLSLYAKEGIYDGKPFQLYIGYYDKYGERCAVFFNNTTCTGEWNYCDVSGAAPDNALYAIIQVVSGRGKGTIAIDKLEFTAEGADTNAPVKFEGDWSINDTNHPRLYFNQKGLERITKFTKSKGVCAYGYAGTVTYRTLLREADGLLEMTVLNGNHHLSYPLYPVLEDASCRPEFEIPPEGFAYGYPYLTMVAQRISSMVHTLSLAYAISGEEKYGERAVQYALDICDWQYWCQYNQISSSTERSTQQTGDLTDAVAGAYDMCYDLLTEAEREKICRAVIDKGLAPMLNDCWPRMLRGRDMDHATCMLTAACAIMNEDNMDELKPYMDMGMTYVNWRLNHFMYSGVNEGHMYDSLAIDDIVVTLDIVERGTGYSGPWSHPYMDELQERVLGFFDPVNGQLPAYSDADFASYYPYSMAVFSQRGNMLATYYLSMSDALSSTFDQLVYFTEESLSTLEPPLDNEHNVGYVAAHGFGALRTGFGMQDSLLVINANNSQQEHNHFDQNSLLLAFNGSWMLSDTEYKDNSYSDLTNFQMKYSNTTIFVDGKPQVRKGQGSLDLVFDNTLYGYFIGSAPGAYGMEDKQQVLNKFDRHTIMINHDSQPYYLIIDDLESNTPRTFGWNYYTNGWDRFEMDGEMVEKGGSATGNRVTISRFGSTLHSYFVGNKPITSKEVTYHGYGPTLMMESEKTKSYQFMNVMSIQKGSGSQISNLFEHMMTGPSSTELKYSAEGEISWETNKADISKNAILSVTIGGPLVMFRGGLVGDWIEFPFEVKETREYGVTIDVGRTMEYSGTWNLYLDGELIGIYEPNGPTGIITIDAGKRTLTAGDHKLKAVMSGTPETVFNGTIMSVGSITLDTGESMGEGIVKVTDTYDNENVLGAAVSYGTVLSDVVLFNRGTGTVSAGKLTTDGKQASVLGLYNDEINEGYAVTNATSMKYGDLLLMSANGPASVAVDYTFAKLPIKNTDDEKEIELHEDFDIDEPVIKVSTSATESREISILVGKDYPYVATLNGETLESTYQDGMLTLTIPEGDNNIEIRGEHQCVFDQHATNILNIKEWANCDHGNIYYVSCVCQRNGTETFEDEQVRGHKLSKVEAVAATETEDGCIEHWKCTRCDRLFADAKGTQELNAADVVVNKLTSDAPQSNVLLIVGIVAGAVVLAGAIVAVIIIKKRKTK